MSDFPDRGILGESGVEGEADDIELIVEGEEYDDDEDNVEEILSEKGQEEIKSELETEDDDDDNDDEDSENTSGGQDAKVNVLFSVGEVREEEERNGDVTLTNSDLNMVDLNLDLESEVKNLNMLDNY